MNLFSFKYFCHFKQSIIWTIQELTKFWAHLREGDRVFNEGKSMNMYAPPQG